MAWQDYMNLFGGTRPAVYAGNNPPGGLPAGSGVIPGIPINPRIASGVMATTTPGAGWIQQGVQQDLSQQAMGALINYLGLKPGGQGAGLLGSLGGNVGGLNSQAAGLASSIMGSPEPVSAQMQNQLVGRGVDQLVHGAAEAQRSGREALAARGMGRAGVGAGFEAGLARDIAGKSAALERDTGLAAAGQNFAGRLSALQAGLQASGELQSQQLRPLQALMSLAMGGGAAGTRNPLRIGQGPNPETRRPRNPQMFNFFAAPGPGEQWAGRV